MVDVEFVEVVHADVEFVVDEKHKLVLLVCYLYLLVLLVFLVEYYKVHAVLLLFPD